MGRNRRRCIILVYLLIVIYIIQGTDMDFGVFQYKGSRLKKIEWYFMKNGREKKVQTINYSYDDDGYLTGRSTFNYKSSIRYDLENNIVYEDVDRKTGFDKPMPVYWEYYYDNNRRLVNYKRKDSNIYNDKISLSHDVYIEYNKKGDITKIYDKEGSATEGRGFPGEGMGLGAVHFDYEYKEGMKVRYAFTKFGKLHDSDFVYENNRLIKIVSYADKEKKFLGMVVYLKYDERGNIIETLFEFYNSNSNEVDHTKRYTYEYDKQDRLIKKIIYDSSTFGGKPYRVEKYTYEDGPYVHFPYLLPTTRIVIYLDPNTDEGIEKNMF